MSSNATAMVMSAKASFGILTAAALAALAVRFQLGRKLAEDEWSDLQPQPLENLGMASSVRILPLVEAESADPRLLTEPGVAYLIDVDGHRILFDLGFNGRGRSPLVENARQLGVDLSSVDLVVISHPHPDHVGGVRPALGRSLHVSADTGLRPTAKVLAPVLMRSQGMRCAYTAAPTVLRTGVAKTGTIQRTLFFFGRTPEQALLVNVKRRGLVLIVGCGHQGVPRLLARVEALIDAPLYGIVGGLHLPVHGLIA